jgi:3-methyladenine DNA glycosylase AlkC
MAEKRRKGATRMKDIPPDILHQLSMGLIETVTLVEYLAADRRLLLESVLKQSGLEKYLRPILTKTENITKTTALHVTIGAELSGLALKHKELLPVITNHPSDIVRAWATATIWSDSTLTIEDALNKIQPFAADKHAFVREEAWGAVRNKIIDNLDDSIKILSDWAKNRDANLRRFASEATRPRGVWCKHIERLKENPELALPILEPLKSDESKYVQDSVGNWLNDASKTKPDFVKGICAKWEKESGTKETKHIINKALRTINKRM